MAVGGPEPGGALDRLIQLLARLPGLGPRSARRVALHLLARRESLMAPLAAAMAETLEKVRPCPVCGNLDTVEPCAICRDAGRDGSVLCVVENVGDLWAIERSAAFRGRYHVLGGHLSAIDGVGPGDLRIDGLIGRLGDGMVREVVLALNATVDGQTTAHYIADILADRPIAVTRLAHGVPVGGELDYLDDGTLAAALRARRPSEG
ncbi:recombination mediator RecR [Zavarzinia compransoris]|uniref:recombination mediator RecR n=1 Tax=Zavarzinia marina TaxID=2911065 RepID=UPI001F2B7C1F|nr:recombination mediator RecR [Zavarzinia marina]MCF4165828.1 recombination mediator RecR [Zavarzinia marina]